MCQPYRLVSPGCRLPGKPSWRFQTWLNPVPLTDSPSLVLRMLIVFFFRWPAKRMVVTVDVACLDILSVLLSQVELVGLNLLREHVETLFVEFHLGDEVGRLVVCVPAEMIHISVAVDDAGTNLCPKLDLGLCLAPDDGTEVRLIDTDDAVGTSTDVLLLYPVPGKVVCKFDPAVGFAQS